MKNYNRNVRTLTNELQQMAVYKNLWDIDKTVLGVFILLYFIYGGQECGLEWLTHKDKQLLHLNHKTKRPPFPSVCPGRVKGS